MRIRICLVIFSLFLLTACVANEAVEDSSQAISEKSDFSGSEETVEPSEPSEISKETSEQEIIEETMGEKLVKSLTLEEKVGQLFLAAYPDVGAESYISDCHLGGFIMFGREFKGSTPEQIKAKIGSHQESAKIPLLFAVDEEGGTVCRVSAYSQFRESRFPSPRTLFNKGGIDAIIEAEQEKCVLLKSLGINVNMAPVCDITTEKSAFMYSRSLGQSPEITAEFVKSVISVTDENNIGNVLKHFPGYGNNVDTHIGIAVDERTLDELEGIDLIPFKAGVESGCGAILVSHTIVKCLDGEMPASLSKAVHDYIRGTLGFDGVIVTDDLTMQAITDNYGSGEAAVLAVMAGNDLICCSNFKVQYNAVLQAVRDGRISIEQVDEACARVIDWKYKLGLIE